MSDITPEFLTTRDGRRFRLNTPEEEATIQRGIAADPDSRPLSNAEWKATLPTVRIGRPKSAVKKVQTAIRFDPDVLEGLRALGKGWQTQANDALREWLKTRAFTSSS